MDFMENSWLQADVIEAFHATFLTTNSQQHADVLDDSMSGICSNFGLGKNNLCCKCRKLSKRLIALEFCWSLSPRGLSSELAYILLLAYSSQMMAYDQPSDIHVNFELELCVKEILSFIKPAADDTLKRQNAINELSAAILTDQSLRGASVKPFGSFISNLYTRWGDLDISIDLTQSNTSTDRWRKLSALQKIMWALERAGVADNIEFVRHSRVPIVVYQSKYYNISCDISIDNHAGYVKSYVLRLISNIDERFRELVLLIKECAKAQNINDPKTRTLNSYSLCLLIIFHFQTCRPAIFPPLRDLYESSIVNDVKGHTTLRYIEDSFAGKIARFRYQISGQRNRSSICQLLISFFDKFSGLDAKASNYVMSTYTGQWKPISIINRRLWKSQSLLIEDPFEQTENAARAVDSRGLTLISQAFRDMHGKLSSRFVDRASLMINLVRPEIRSKLEQGRIQQPRGYTASSSE